MHVGDADGDDGTVDGGGAVVGGAVVRVGRGVTGTVGREAVAVGEVVEGDALVLGGRE
ncbi:hypothetical protein [Streptomyces sp. NPDC021224]|uniref:hypothetical protein n=1 Tax=unclassified Streptomyces TaxID=2593676 RepID=UPI0037AFA0C4